MSPCRRHVVLTAAALVAGAHEAGAQTGSRSDDGGPVIVGENTSRWRGAELKSFTAGLDFNSRFRNDKLSVPGQADLADRESRLRESVDLSGEAYFGHKNLVDFTGTAELGLEQLTLDSQTTGTNNRQNQTNDLYNLNFLLFGTSMLATNVYTRRDEVLLDQSFSGSIDSITNETGFVTNIRSAVAPSMIRAFHLENTQTDLLGQNNSSLDQNTISGQSNIAVGDGHRLDVTYTFDQINEKQGSTFENDYERNDILLADTLTFGRLKRDQLHSFLRYYSESGKFPYETLRWDEQMLITHNDRLETRYNTTVEKLTRGDMEQTLGRGDANVRHRLFDSLISTGTIGGQYLTTSEQFNSSELFLNGALEYTKKVTDGRVDATVGAGVNLQENSDRGGTLLVVDEAHIFSDPLPIVLSRRNIVEGSIVMTAVGGFPTYQNGPDYTVAYFPDRAEVRINPGRGITNGQTLLFDYTIGPEPGSNINTLSTGISVRYTFTETFLRGLAVYSSYRTQDSTVDAVDPSLFVLDNTKVLVYGTEYRRGGLNVRAEQEKRSSTVNPYDTTRLEAQYDYVLGPGSVITASGSYNLIDYSKPVNHVEFATLTGRWEQRLSESLSMNVRLDLRNDKDQISGDSNGLEEHLGFQWKYRQTNMYLNISNSTLDSDASQQVSQTLEFGVHRNF